MQTGRTRRSEGAASSSFCRPSSPVPQDDRVARKQQAHKLCANTMWYEPRAIITILYYTAVATRHVPRGTRRVFPGAPSRLCSRSVLKLARPSFWTTFAHRSSHRLRRRNDKLNIVRAHIILLLLRLKCVAASYRLDRDSD